MRLSFEWIQLHRAQTHKANIIWPMTFFTHFQLDEIAFGWWIIWPLQFLVSVSDISWFFGTYDFSQSRDQVQKFTFNAFFGRNAFGRSIIWSIVFMADHLVINKTRRKSLCLYFYYWPKNTSTQIVQPQMKFGKMNNWTFRQMNECKTPTVKWNIG